MADITRRTEGASGRWDPFQVMRELSRFDPFLGREGPGRELVFAPDFDVKETTDGYLFRADVPGVEEKDLDITMSGNRLTIAGRREQVHEEEGDRWFAAERVHGTFSRSFTLPDGTDAEHVRAELKNGVLTLLVPKAAKMQPKRISITPAGAGTTGKTVGVKA